MNEAEYHMKNSILHIADVALRVVLSVLAMFLAIILPSSYS